MNGGGLLAHGAVAAAGAALAGVCFLLWRAGQRDDGPEEGAVVASIAVVVAGCAAGFGVFALVVGAVDLLQWLAGRT